MDLAVSDVSNMVTYLKGNFVCCDVRCLRSMSKKFNEKGIKTTMTINQISFYTVIKRHTTYFSNLFTKLNLVQKMVGPFLTFSTRKYCSRPDIPKKCLCLRAQTVLQKLPARFFSYAISRI